MPLLLDASVINVMPGVVIVRLWLIRVRMNDYTNPAVQSPRSPPSPPDVEPDVLPASRNARSADARFAIVIDGRMM